MVLTERQRTDLHKGIYEYLTSRDGEAFQRAAAALAEADPDSCNNDAKNTGSSSTPLLEKKWTAIPRLQKKVLELERAAAQNAKIHAHRTGGATAVNGTGGGERRMLPRLPCAHTLQGHSANVETVAVHPVFTVVASGSEDGTVKIWDHESGDYIRTLKGHTNTVTSLSFTPTGAYLASCSTDLSIKLWDFSTYACLRTLRGHDHSISDIKFLPSGSSGASSTTSTSGGEKTSSTTTGMDATVAGCTNLLSASRDQTVKVWDIETGFCDQTISDHSEWVRVLAVRQHDGGLFASSGNDQVINVYDRSRNKVAELRGHEHVVEALAFITEEANPKAAPKKETKHLETVWNYLASGSRDRCVKLWSISSVSCLATFKHHENWVRSVQIHPSGNYIISAGDDRTIRVFDIKANRCLRTLEDCHSHFVTSISMHHTLPILVSGSVDQTVKCWLLD